MVEDMKVIDGKAQDVAENEVEAVEEQPAPSQEDIVRAINGLGEEVALIKQMLGYKADAPLVDQIKPVSEEMGKLHEKMYPTLSDGDFANKLKAMSKLIVG